MVFVKRCLRVQERGGKPSMNSRCKNNTEVNGVLCKDCLKEAKQHPVYILMNNAVTSIFNIPFKNQLFVKLDLSKKVKDLKPKSESSQNLKIKALQSNLMEELDKLSDSKLKAMHDELGLNIWNTLKKQKKTKYAIRYMTSKEIINRFAISGISQG
jgi:predicted amidophosphoribosyltransferase